MAILLLGEENLPEGNPARRRAEMREGEGETVFRTLSGS